ncbi:MAG TPA: extensin family protein [Pseudolabrys sp.]|nr:extensin family protein [Pseudolabrys sp.]
MKGGVAYCLIGAGVLLALAGCGRGIFTGERAPWRHQAEVECMKSGSVKLGAGVVRMEPIEGPGMCGADFPLKVAVLGEGAAAIGYGDDLRPPASIPNASQMPNWPINEPRYTPPAPIGRVDVQPMPTQPGQPRMRWVPGPPPAERAAPMGSAGRPVELSPPGIAPGVTPSAAPLPDDIPDDAVLPNRTYPPQRAQPAPVYQSPQRTAPVYQPSQRSTPTLGPARVPRIAAATPATLTPAATLACPLVSALDHWVSDGVQPAAMHWFGSQVVEIKQISSYSCRGMVGAGGSGISEHAFGNAIDIAAFTFADGRRVTVQDGWHGTPEEQGFLRDVHLAACDNFTTVLAPGYNAAHYNHIHVDLMRRANGDRPCRPEAMTGEVAAAKARALYAKHRGPAYTGAVPVKASRARTAVPGEDGYILDLENPGDVTGATYRSNRRIEQHSAK